MNRQRSFWMPLFVTLVLVALLAGSERIEGQATTAPGQASPVAPIGSRMPVAGFLSAPAFNLSDVPSSVVSTDLDGDGKPDLVVAFTSAGKIVVYLGAGKGKFAAPVEYSAGGHPVAIAAIDINGDGQPDIVTANGADGTVSVLTGVTGGKLATAVVSTVGVDANYLAIGDLNGDGLQDVVIASSRGKALAILLNDGRGALKAASLQALGKTPTGLVTGDFNGDRHPDAAIASDDGTVEVLLGGGDGTLQMASSFVVSGAKIWSLVTADFNHDGSPDLAVTQADGRLLTTFLGKGDGTFGVGSSYLVGNAPIFTAAVDVNGDGVVDLISVNQGSNTMSVLLGSGDGTFQSAKEFTVGAGPVAVAAGDFYGTGFTGLAVVDAAAKTLNAVAGKGDGTFRAAPSYSGDLSPRAIASGDLNGDGLPDLVVTNFCGSDAKCAKGGSLSIYLGQAAGGYKLASTQAVGIGPISVVLADLNGDGHLDVLALNRSDKTLSVSLGVGDGTLQAPSTTTLVGSPMAMIAKDFNQDGAIDLAVVSDCGSAKCTQPGSVDVYFGTGEGSFTLGASYPVSYSPTSIAAGDLNGDSILDLVVANACGKDSSCNSAGTATVLLGGVKGIFSAQADIALNNAPSSIALRSATGKRPLDMIVTHAGDNTVAVLSGNGDGSFQTPAIYHVGNSPRSIAIADLNGDGIPDVAVANAKDSTVTVLYGKSDGTLVAGASYAVAAGPEALTAVPGTAGLPASLVTANGNSASSPAGSEITSLANASPNVGSTPSSTALSITATNPTVNGSVTLTATVTTVTPPDTDGDSVNFTSDGGVTITDCTNPAVLSGGIASCTTSQLTGGTRTIIANFLGDATYNTSSDTQTQVITAAGANLAITAPAGTLTVNQTITFTATLTPASGSSFSPTPPSGTISFTVNGQAVTGCSPTTASATVLMATCAYTPTSTATLAVAASYSNDVNFTVASPGTYSQTVSPAAATLTVTGPSTTPTVNQNATFTATLSANAGFTPTAASGSIAFTINGQAVSGCNPTSASATVLTATCTYTATAAGTLAVAANYSNDANFTVATPGTLSQTVNSAPATLTVTGPSATPTVNQTATFTATLAANAGFTPTAASGTISFTVNGQAAGCASTQATASVLTATCAYTPTARGTLAVAASYSNDPNFTVATPGTLSQAVNAAPATLTVTGPSTPPTVNQSAAFTATLASTAGFTPTAASGVISFTINGQTVSGCSPTTASATVLTATCTYTPVASGTLAVAANYSNDTNFTVATPGTLSQTVSPVAATLAVTGPSTPPTVNQTATFTATLSSPAGFTPTAASGMISFTINGNAASGCSPATVSATVLTATCTYTPTAAGTLAVAATYGNDVNFTVANPGTLSQTVNPAAATLSLAGSSTPLVVNRSTTFTATLASSTGFTPGAASGMISFTINGQAASGCSPTPLSATVLTATCTYTPLAAGTLAVVASYSNDPNFTVANPATLSPTVTPISATLTLAGPTTTPTVNQNVTFTATLGAGSGSFTPTAPSGTISLAIMGQSGATCQTTMVSGTIMTANCTITALAAGSLSVVATYAGDANYVVPGGASSTLTQTINKIPTTLGLSQQPATSNVNTNVTFTATLGASPTAPTVPTGTVSFTVRGDSSICAPVTLSAGSLTATCVTSNLVYPSDVVVATYSGDGNYTGPSTATVTQTVNKIAAQTVVTTSTNSSVVNQPVTFTATLQGTTPGSIIPGGSVTFRQGSNIICSGAVVLAPASSTTSTATCQVAFTAVSSAGNAVTATYSGDANFTPGTAGTSSAVTVGPATTTVALTATPSPSGVDQNVTFTATIGDQYAGTTLPTGTVSFVDQTVTPFVTLCPSVTLTGTTATCPVPLLYQGVHSIVATFTASSPGGGASANFTGSSSAIFAQTVNAAATSLSLMTSSASVIVNAPVTFTATVTRTADPTYTGTTLPAGAIAFTDGSTPIVGCTSVAVAINGTATCTTTFSTATTHAVSAVYTPSTAPVNFLTSSGGVAQVVGLAGSAISLPTQPSSTVDSPVTFTATVAAAPTGTGTPTGMVTFTDTSTGSILCTVQLTSSSAGLSASCTFAFLTAGTHPIQATYSGDTNFTGSSISAYQVVGSTTTTLAVTSSPSTSSVNQTVAFTIVLTPTVPGTALPNGTVTLTDTLTGAVLCRSAVAANGTVPSGACQTAFLVAGTHLITSGFVSSDPNFQGSSAPNVSQVVQPTATTLAIASSSGASAPTSVAMQPVTFTATVTPAIPGAALPTGLVTFTLSSGDSCQAVPLVTSASPYKAACTISFANLINGPITVSATYTPTAGVTNFVTSTATLTQTVQNFTLAAAAQPARILLTEGFNNATDPFNPATVTLTSASQSSFADPLTVLSCVATNSAGAVQSASFCTVNALANTGNGNVATFTLTADPAAPVGAYTVTVTAANARTPALTHLATFVVNVIAQVSPSSLSAGSSSGPLNVPFSVATPADTFTFACGTILYNGQATTAITCTPAAASGSLTAGFASFSITAAPSTHAMALPPRGPAPRVFTAALFGIPLLALAGLLRRRRALSTLPRLAAALTILVGLLQTVGCGGGFTTTVASATGVTAGVGTYLIQVTATDSTTHVVYDAVISVTIRSASGS